MDTTAHDLKLLSIGFFIQGGIILCYGMLFFCYLGVAGAVIASVQRNLQTGAGNAIPAGLMAVIGVVVVGIAVMTLLMGSLMLWAGFSLRKRQHRILILVMAGLNCLSVPYGTVLGIFTLMVMQRPAAKEMFGVVAVPLPPPVMRQA